MTVLELAESATTLHPGKEYAGPCPFCGGRDRFHIDPERDQWRCRGCMPRWSDAIKYVRMRDSVGYLEACRRLRVEPGERQARGIVARPAPPEPSPEWRAAAEEVVHAGQSALWRSLGGVTALRYLRKRGLNDDVIRAAELGFSLNEKWVCALRVYGLAILIPWRVAGQLWQIKARFLYSNDPKYKAITWGRPTGWPAGQAHLYGADTMAGRDIGFLVEGEFDALLLHQEAGDLAGVGTLGSCAAPFPARAARHLLPLQRIVVAYDADDAGRDGARRLQAQFRSFERAEVPCGKDVGEFHQAGGSLRDWVRDITTRRTP